MDDPRYPAVMRALRYLVALAAWAAAGYISLWVASNTAVGPTVAVFDADHGLHEGDVFVMLVTCGVAALITLAAFHEPRRAPAAVTRSGAPASRAAPPRPAGPGRG